MLREHSLSTCCLPAAGGSLATTLAAAGLGLLAACASACSRDRVPGTPPGRAATRAPAPGEAAPREAPGAAARETRPGESALDRAATAPAAGAGTAPGVPQGRETPSSAEGDCDAILASLREAMSRIPHVFRDLDRSRQEIHADMLQGIEVAERYLDRCSGAPAAHLVRAALARLLFGRYEYEKESLQKAQMPAEEIQMEMQRYLERVLSLAEAARDGSPRSSEAWCEAVSLLADQAFKEGAFERHREQARAYLENCPGAEGNRPHYLVTMGQSYVFEGRYLEAAHFMRQAAERYASDPELALYRIVLFEALSGQGDLEGMERLLESIRKEYPERLEKVESRFLRVQYRQWLDVSTFWLGFADMAQGDREGALRRFESFVSEMDARAAALAEEGQRLEDVQAIFRQFRAPAFLSFLRDRLGRRPEVDLGRGIEWVTENRLDLDRAAGKVVVVLFRMPEAARSRTMLEEVDRLVRAHAGVTGAVLGFQSPGASEERRRAVREKMLAELAELGIDLPAGLDTAKGHETIEKLNGRVGSPCLVVLDREGRFAWYLDDLRDLDRRILERVVERLLEESGPPAP